MRRLSIEFVRVIHWRTRDEAEIADNSCAVFLRPFGLLSMLLPAEGLVFVYRSPLLCGRLDERSFVHELPLLCEQRSASGVRQ